MKVFAIGDTGGHKKVLFKGLESIGVDPYNHIIPDDITIIHTGDIIHKGPTPPEVLLSFVQKMQKNNPGQWVQLLGNHELMHVGFPSTPFWRCGCPSEVDETVASMFDDGSLLPAYSIKGLKSENLILSKRTHYVPETEDWLFVHGGLTNRWWKTHHEQEADVHKLADDINSLTIAHLIQAGERMGYGRVSPSPVWASAPTEVFSSWEGEVMPFNQVTGHTYAYDWERGRWFRKPPKGYYKSTKLNPELRASVTKIGESVLVGIDPGFELSPPKIDSQPVILLGVK